MTNYIYDQYGNAVGFWRGRYVYELCGTPIGQLNGTRHRAVRISAGSSKEVAWL